jgi:mono/diheme cytochrome c family protein
MPRTPYICQAFRAAAFAFAAVALAGAIDAPAASAQGFGTERGRALAQQWCARCHAVTAAQERSGETDVPPFRRIAADRRWTRDALIRMMTVPHLNMPPPVLTRAEAEEVATYVQSLR